MINRDWTAGASLAATLVAGALLLCLPAFINGQPLLFTDTTDYISDGLHLVRFEWFENRRPVFYGLAIWFLHWERTVWPVVFAQGLVVSHLIWLTLRALGAAPRPPVLLGVVLALTVATPLAWYVSQIVPDVFLGVVVLALFLLGFCRGRLGTGEAVYLFLLASASICFHLSFLAVALAIAAVTAAAWSLRRTWRAQVRPLLVAGPIALSLAALFSFSLVMHQQVSLGPTSPPFLLARLLADGPAKAYLRASCARTPYRLCGFFEELPDWSDGILWMSPQFSRRVMADAIRAESGSIIAGTTRMFPGWVAGNMAKATALQLVTIASEANFHPDQQRAVRTHYPYLGPDYGNSLQGRGLLNEGSLAGMNRFHAAVAAAGLAAAGLLAAACARRRAFRPIILLGLIALSLVTNAFVTGALSVVSERYQGRGVWLLPFLVIAAGLDLLRSDAVRGAGVFQRSVPVR